MMKKEYSKPEIDTKAFAQFENVFTACSKGNESVRGCISGIFDTPSTDPSGSAAFKSNMSM